MTRSSIVAAVVVTILLGLLIWLRDEHPTVERSTRSLTPSSGALPRATGKVTEIAAVPRSVSPSPQPPIVYEVALDAGAPTSR